MEALEGARGLLVMIEDVRRLSLILRPLALLAQEGSKYPNKLRFDLNAVGIASTTEAAIEGSKKALDAIAGMAPSWAIMLAYSDEDALFSMIREVLVFPSSVSPDKSVRDASVLANEKIQAYNVEKMYREDVYNAVKAYSAVHDKSQHSAEENRFLDKTLEDYERTGIHLEKSKRDRLKELKKEMAELRIKFQQNVREDKTHALFTKEELDGMSEDYLSGLEKVDDKYKVTLKMPDFFPLSKMCKNVETRKKVDMLKESQCKEINEPLLERVVELRREEALLLGFKSHAEYALKIKMAKNPETVWAFLNELNERVRPLMRRDLNEFLACKKQECEQRGIPFDNTINSYDYRYYYNMVLETRYQLNEEEIQQYFPLDHVTKEMLDIYQSLLGLTFKPEPNPHVWHEDVKQYQVYDSDTNAFMGHFYLDLHPREGKHGHASEFGLLGGCYVRGKKNYPAAAMVANFSKPTKEKPSCLRFQEVTTFFHEFGHVMHELMSTAHFALFAGTNTEVDFVEAPSQMLENWCYEPDILARLSKHVTTGASLPEALRLRLVTMKRACSGMIQSRQLLWGFMDMTFATAVGKIDTASIFNRLRLEITEVAAPPNSNAAASFGHIIGGYSAGYYGYLWSEVFSCDLFTVFKKNGILDNHTGRRYREIILAPGGTRDPSDMIREFLGREPTQDAFLAYLGLTENN